MPSAALKNIRVSQSLRQSRANTHTQKKKQALKERNAFFAQYEIYGRYVTQEERDIDRTLRTLDNIFKGI